MHVMMMMMMKGHQSFEHKKHIFIAPSLNKISSMMHAWMCVSLMVFQMPGAESLRSGRVRGGAYVQWAGPCIWARSVWFGVVAFGGFGDETSLSFQLSFSLLLTLKIILLLVLLQLQRSLLQNTTHCSEWVPSEWESDKNITALESISYHLEKTKPETHPALRRFNSNP